MSRGSVLDLVPLSLNARTEIPVSIGPTAHVAERFEVFSEFFHVGNSDSAVAVRDRIHNKPDAHDAGPVHESGSPR